MANVMSLPAMKPGTEVTAKAGRRKFSAECKARVLRELESCSKKGGVGAPLRREGLYSSHELASWRAGERRAESGERARRGTALSPKKREPKPQAVNKRDEEIATLRREVALMTRRAERAEAIVELQKSLAAGSDAGDEVDADAGDAVD